MPRSKTRNGARKNPTMRVDEIRTDIPIAFLKKVNNSFFDAIDAIMPQDKFKITGVPGKELPHKTSSKFSGVRKEIQLTDALRILNKEKPIYAVKFSGKRYDTGDKLGYIEASVEYALRDKEIGKKFKKYLKNI